MIRSSFWPTTTPLGSTDEKICASHTNVCLFLLKRTWNFSSQSFVKWTDEQVSFLTSVLVVSFNMLYICHIFFALLSCLHQYMKTFMIQFPALELSLAGLNFHSQVFVSHRYSRLVHLKFCMWYFFQNFCQIFKHCKGIVFSPSSVTKYSCSITFLDDWTSSMWVNYFYNNIYTS